MKKIIKNILEFIKDDFGWSRYISSIGMLIFMFYLYYTKIINNYLINNSINFSHYYLAQLVVIFAVFYLISIQKLKLNLLIFTTFSVLILYLNYSTKSSFNYFVDLISLDPKLNIWAKKVFINFQKPVALVLPLLIPYFFHKKRLNSFYGFTTKGFDYKPYLIMLLFMVPLIFAAAYGDSFQRMYPRYKPSIAEDYGLINHYVSVISFEASYVLRFVGVEAFFRGFLVIGGFLLFGKRAILPAACIYSIWHFGKPMGEAVGAFFGAYVLGIIAYKSKSIFGGIAIHYGVALLMELSAWYWILN
ncbi:CPBP family intramembrane metalloprotease [Candidatus Kapabacteria bacterium]|nr:CPBP family intramembrane metalloprotease [Candidatus Kapabacteria bacterium]